MIPISKNKFFKKSLIQIVFGLFILIIINTKLVFSQCSPGIYYTACNLPFAGNIASPSSQTICPNGQDSIAIFNNTVVGAPDSIVYYWPFGSPLVQGFSGNFTGVLKRVIPYNPDTVCIGLITIPVCADFYQNCSGTMTKVGYRQVDFLYYPRPRPEFHVTSNDSLCINQQPFHFILDCALPGYVTYFWDFGDPSVTSDTLTGVSPFYSYSQPGTYTVTCTATHLLCGSLTYPLTVVVGPRPTPLINATPFIFCTGTQCTLNAGSGYSNYQWSTGATTQNIIVSTPGNYTVTVSNAFGCTATTDTSVSTYPLANVQITGLTSVCLGNFATLDAGAGYAGYLWSTGATTQTINASVSGTYTVTVTDANGCTASDNHLFVVSNSLSPSISGVLAVCSGVAATLDAGAGYNSYSWSTGATTQIINPSVVGIYTVTVSDANGCTGTANLNIPASTSPIPAITGLNVICAGTPTIFDAGAGYNSYAWSTGATTQTISPTNTGLYSVTVTNSNGCSGSDSFTLTVNPNPTPVITGNLSICQNNLASATLNAGNGYTAYQWSTGATTQTINPTSTGAYTVTVTNNFNCSGSGNAIFTVNSNPSPTITGTTAVCQGIPSSLNAGIYTSYLWSTGATTQNINPLLAGNYTVTVTDANGCTGNAFVNVIVSANPVPVISGTNVICQGITTTFDAGIGYNTYAWSTGATTQTINPTTNGAYTVTVSNSAGCTGSDTYSLTVNPSPTPVIAGTTIICQNNLASAILDAGNGYSTYQWSTGATTQVINPITSGTYTVSVSNNFNCFASTSANFTVNNNPVPAITGINSICQGSSTTFDAGTGYSNYVWSTGATTQTINLTAGTNYTVTVTDGNGCTGTANSILTVNPLPVTTVTGNSPICNGFASSLNAGAGFSSYIWSTGATTQAIAATVSSTYYVTVSNAFACTTVASFSLTVNPNPSPTISGASSLCIGSSVILNCGSGFISYQWSTGAITQNISVNVAGTYTVTVSDINSCTGVISKTITANPLPNPSISGTSAVCNGSSATLNAGAGFSSYLWSTGAITQTIIATTSGNYSVIVSDNNNCTNAAYFNFTVYPLPSPVITGLTSLCLGESTTLNSGSGFQNYLWSTGATTQSINTTFSGTFTVTVTDVNGCTGIASKTVIVHSLPTPTITGNPLGCSGVSSIFDAGSGFPEYLWSTGAITQTISTTTPGNYTVIVTDNFGCTGNASFLFTVYPNPTPIITGVNVICYGTSSILSCPNNYQNYIWSTGENTQSIIANVIGNYSVTVIDTNGCVGNSSSFYLNVENATAYIVPASSQNLCQGSSVTLTANSGLSYQWSDGSTTQSISVAISGSYFVTVTDPNGCSATSQIISTYLQDNPIINFVPDYFLDCSLGYGIALNNYSVCDSGSLIRWDFGDGNYSSLISPIHYYRTTGSFWIKLKIISPYGCTSIDSLLVNTNFNPPAEADFKTNPDREFIFGKPIDFIDQSNNAVSWRWDFKDGTTSNERNASHKFDHPGIFNVTLVVTNVNGCEVFITKEVIISPFMIPNAFSPNNDGKNDTFFPCYQNYYDMPLNDYYVRIFSRGGQLIFESYNYNDPWDGTFNGKQVPMGVYVYRISASIKNEKEGSYRIEKVGTVTLIR